MVCGWNLATHILYNILLERLVPEDKSTFGIPEVTLVERIVGLPLTSQQQLITSYNKLLYYNRGRGGYRWRGGRGRGTRGRGGGYRDSRPSQRREGTSVGTTNWDTEDTKPEEEPTSGGGRYSILYMLALI